MKDTMIKIGNQQHKLLEKLTNAVSVSGDEGAVRKIVLDQITPIVDEVKVDALGNVLATKKGSKPGCLKVMIAAHMDEIGFMITSGDSKGIFRFAAVGGIDSRQLAGKPVWVGKDKVPGVIGAKPIHLTTASERKNTISIDSLRIDVGEKSASKVQVGDRATFATAYQRLGPSIRAKALDDRLGILNLIEMLKNSPPNIDLLAAFTVQEEVGLRGAKVAAFALEPDMALALDCTPAYDLPAREDEENTRYNTRLDHGPALYVADGATISDPRLIRHFINTAEAQEIPYQIRQAGGGGTDAGVIHKQRVGIPSMSISVPGRYLHTAASIVRIIDWQNTLNLVHAALSELKRNIFESDR
jgi:putative aminopeptidase FrvX